jgi:hypothetical protein
MVLDIGVLVKGTGSKMAHPKSHDYLPLGMFRTMLQIAGDNKLSVKEVKIMFLRYWCEQFGFKCEHLDERIAYAENTHKPYCKDCWRRLEKKESKVFENGKLVKKTEYIAIETFLDRLLKEKA